MRKTPAMKRLSESFYSRIFILLSLIFFLSSNAYAGIFDGGDPAKGEGLFNANCASCHSIDGSLVNAPSLLGVDARWKGKDALIVKWIQNPTAALGTGDAYIKALVETNKAKYGMMAAQNLSEADIKDVLAYVKTPPAGKGAAPSAGDNKCITLEEEKAALEANQENDGLIWMLIVGVILAIVAVSAANISRSLKSVVNERDGLPALPDVSYARSLRKWLWENKKFVSVIGLFIFCYFSVVGYKALMDIGVYDGYTPEQPIWFSHSIHACQNEVDCQYCHSSAAESKHAGIPSANVCMNCHKGIKKGAISGTTQIAKIYEAIGFNPDSASYIPNYQEKPIKWVKVHNLPDHVYFNHSQHVTVGKIDCRQCHGPVEKYTVGHVATADEINSQKDLVGLIQLEKRPLTMGWCLECHNKSGIDVENGSNYYKDIHERFKSNSTGTRTWREIMEDGKSTVREMGGWECGKCHY
jgi:mono/diheme cytochrome c family protein